MVRVEAKKDKRTRGTREKVTTKRTKKKKTVCQIFAETSVKHFSNGTAANLISFKFFFYACFRYIFVYQYFEN